MTYFILTIVRLSSTCCIYRKILVFGIGESELIFSSMTGSSSWVVSSKNIRAREWEKLTQDVVYIYKDVIKALRFDDVVNKTESKRKT